MLRVLHPILLVQAPPAPDERRFYQHILSTIGAPMWGRHTVSELEVRALSQLRDMDLKILMIDEVHNLLAGSYREQRQFLNMLRFLANDLCASLVVFGVNEALEAVRGDDQLARRLDEHYLPLWEDDVEFSRLIQTLIAAMALEQRSGLTVASLRTILKVTGGVTSRVFIMITSLAIEAIETDEERINDEAVQSWQPILTKHAWSIPRQAHGGVRVILKPLPLRPPPVRDELLSSWIRRLARANHCSVEDLCGYLGLGQDRVPERTNDLFQVNWARLCSAFLQTRDQIEAMTLSNTMHLPVQCVSSDDFQIC